LNENTAAWKVPCCVKSNKAIKVVVAMSKHSLVIPISNIDIDRGNVAL
jgi:hypothetical protein